MRADPPTDAERKVIRWFFGMAFGVAILFIAWGWLSRKQECTASCEAKGFKSGCLQLNEVVDSTLEPTACVINDYLGHWRNWRAWVRRSDAA